MKVLLLNQCFWPDVVATAQQLTDLARGLAERGHEVTVVCSDRGYDDQEVRFPRRERWHNIEILRVRSLRAEKNARWRRALNFGSFLIACAFRLFTIPRQDVVVALTSPPLISWLASWFKRLRGGRMLFWVMDLNPDEAIAAGWLRQESITAKLLESLLKKSMLRSEKIVVLDRFVKSRIVAKGVAEEKIEVIPTWSHDDAVSFDQQGREEFRREHNFAGKFVVMYAGNHSPCHPLDTILAAAKRLGPRNEIVFCFAGGGSEQSKVSEFARANNLPNINCLPYQPVEKLSALLSAADLHLVALGENFPGIVHPSKVYNLLAIQSPFLYVGPKESHLGDLIVRMGDRKRAFHANHGAVDSVVLFILNRAQEFYANGGVAGIERFETNALAAEFSKTELLPRLIAEMEKLSALAPGAHSEPASGKIQSAELESIN